MDLGTTCGVNAAAFSPDNTRAAMACKDGTLILWNIDIRYQVCPNLMMSQSMSQFDDLSFYDIPI